MQSEPTRTDPNLTAPPKVLAACQEAEGKIQEARQWLLDARPGAIDSCQSTLQQTIATLETLIAEKALQPDPAVSSALQSIRRSAHSLGQQIEFASNLYFGWIQLRLGAGYTQQGLPVFATSEPVSRSFEG
jgi:hypothetical protein